MTAVTTDGTAAPDLDAQPVDVSAREGGTLLRFATAGSVDDGKSTLVGRLLHDSKAISSSRWPGHPPIEVSLTALSISRF